MQPSEHRNIFDRGKAGMAMSKLSFFLAIYQQYNMLYIELLLKTGMQFGRRLFIRDCRPDEKELPNTMKIAKQKFGQLQIIFIIIERKGDPVYGNNVLQQYAYKLPTDVL